MALKQTNTQLARPSGTTHAIQGDLHAQNSSIVVAGRDHNTTHIHYYNFPGQDKLSKILEAIPNFRKVQQDTLERATPGTIVWLFECDEFKLFFDIDGVLRILWGSGIPGAGKTILASIVIDWLEALARASKDKICVGYIYIRYSDQDQVTLHGILGTLMKQTVEQHPDCMPLLQQAYERHLIQGTQPTENELIQLLRQFNQRMKVSFYVLDAIDEAPVRIRMKLIQTLSSLGARLFITSRPLPALEAKLPGAFSFTISAKDHDLDLHIEEKIGSSEYLQDLLENAEPSLKAHLISTVKAKCGGMFLHASLQLDALQGCFTIHRAMEILEGFPQDIEDVYQQTWARIVNSEPDHASLATSAFAWVLNAKQSMTIDLLRHALATCPKTYHFEASRLMPESVLLAACRGLITADKESGIVRLVHYTAKEPLENLLRTSSDIPDPHALIAAVCVTYLADRGFQKSTVQSRHQLGDVLGADPFLDYAYDAWVFHTRESCDADLTVRAVSTFVADCEAYPVKYRYPHYTFDLLSSLHMVAFYNLPLPLTGPHIAKAANGLSKIHQWSPLYIACFHGHFAATKALLCLPEIQVNMIGGSGSTALIEASTMGWVAVARLLLAHPNIQVNLAGRDGSTALIQASWRGQEAVVKLLLGHPDLQVNVAIRGSYTALILASMMGQEAVVKLLLSHPNIQVDLADRSGSTALIKASKRGQGAVVKLLLAHPDIQVNLTGGRGLTALIVASWSGREVIVKLLLAHSDIQVNLTDHDGSTALVQASRRGHEAVVKLLLSHPDIQVNLANRHGSTALSGASSEGHQAVVKLLLAHPDIQLGVADGQPK